MVVAASSRSVYVMDERKGCTVRRRAGRTRLYDCLCMDVPRRNAMNDKDSCPWICLGACSPWMFDDLDLLGDHRRQESKDFDEAHRISP